MCLFKKKERKVNIEINSKFHMNDYVDFFYKDDLYFGHISNIYLDQNSSIIYDIDIAGQCPTTFTGIKEEKVVRIHK